MQTTPPPAALQDAAQKPKRRSVKNNNYANKSTVNALRQAAYRVRKKLDGCADQLKALDKKAAAIRAEDEQFRIDLAKNPDQATPPKIPLVAVEESRKIVVDQAKVLQAEYMERLSEYHHAKIEWYAVTTLHDNKAAMVKAALNYCYMLASHDVRSENLQDHILQVLKMQILYLPSGAESKLLRLADELIQMGDSFHNQFAALFQSAQADGVQLTVRQDPERLRQQFNCVSNFELALNAMDQVRQRHRNEAPSDGENATNAEGMPTP